MVAAGGFADLEELAAAGEAGDFVCGDGLVQASEALRDRVLGGLIQGPWRPVRIGEIDGDVAADSHGVFEMRLFQELGDAVGCKDCVGIDADEHVDMGDIGIEGQEGSHGTKELRRDVHDGSTRTDVELVQERPDEEESIPFPLVLLFDDAKVWHSCIETLLNHNVHTGIVPGRVRILYKFPRTRASQDIFQKVIGCRFLHASGADSTVTDDHDSCLVLIDVDLADKGVQRPQAFFSAFVIARQQHHQAFGTWRDLSLFGND